MTKDRIQNLITEIANAPIKNGSPVFNEEMVRDVSEAVYRDLLERESPPAGAVQRMLENDADGGVKLRHRAGAFDRHTRAYFRALRPEAK